MKKLAILAAAAVGYALAERVGRKKDTGYVDPGPVVYTPPAATVTLVPDLPADTVLESVTPEPEPVVSDESKSVDIEAFIEAPAVEVPEDIADESDSVIPSLDVPVSEAEIVSESPVAESTDAELQAAFEAEFEAELAAEAALAAEAEAEAASKLLPGPPAPPSIEPFLKHEEEPQAKPEEVDEEPVEAISPEALETWESNWANDMPFVNPPAEADPKLSDLAENIVSRVQTAADLAREEDQDIDITEDEVVETPDEGTASTSAFVIPTAGDFSDEVFEGEEADASDPVAIDEALLAETGLMDAIDDEELGKKS